MSDNQLAVNHEEEWGEYKKRRNQAFFVILGYIPSCFAFDLLTVKFFHTDIPARIFALFWGLTWVVVGLRFSVLPCPGCGRTIFTHPLRPCSRGNLEA
jgi:hypothetical protein